MTQALPLFQPRVVGESDQRIIVHHKTWQAFQSLQDLFDSPGLKLSYYEGTVEILMPGRDHEFFKTIIGMFIELFCLEKQIEFEPTGSMTQKKEGRASAEPDESYCFGSFKPTPDLSIEVIFTSGNIQRLDLYQSLEVPEVWFWEDGVFKLYRLRSQGYEAIFHSEIPELADLDIALLTRCVLIAQTSRLQAVNEFRQALRDAKLS
jgi:Uma2 family endonuclease